MKRFEVGKTYLAYQEEYTPIKVLKRTDKTIFVENDQGVTWRMRIRESNNGDEYAVDSSVPARYRDAFTYFAESEG